MQYRKTWLILLMVALMALWGCSDDDDDNGPTEPTDTFETVAEAALEYFNDSADCPGVIDADDVKAALDSDPNSWSILDIRAADDYNAGHIPGAINSPLTEVLNVASDQGWDSNEPILVVCYTGQSAGHAKAALELMGYENVKSLKWGMSSWNSQLDRWTPNTGNAVSNPEITDNGDPEVVGFPTLSGSLQDRVEATLAAGFKRKSYGDIEANLENYFIINYFAQEDYMPGGPNGVPGHLTGAWQFTPYQSLGLNQMLDTLPTDAEIIVYCWTGQHSSQVTFFLNMLGYDAYSLTFGSNGLWYDSLTGHKWSEAQTNDYPLATGFTPSATFQTIAEEMAAYVNDSDDCPGVINAADLEAQLDSWQVLDIRAQDDYDAGHIPGAVHSPLGDALTTVANEGWPTDEPIVVACYTGQSAGHVKIALELMGYENVKSLKFGMCSWDASLSDRWDSKTFGEGTPADPDGSGDNLTLVDTANNNPMLSWHDYPAIADGQTVADRVEAMLADGFKVTSFEAIEGSFDQYFILNYFGPDDYMPGGPNGVPGHIPGAYQFTPYQSLGWDQMLGNLPTDQTIVVYCWTGQHSSQVAAYLNMLGYDAVSLAYGSNYLFYSNLTGHKWPGNDVTRALEVTE
jgi:rhodanese-related sulfurtransferase